MNKFVEYTVAVVILALLGLGAGGLVLRWMAGDTSAAGGLAYIGTGSVKAWMDPETGCEYVLTDKAFIPRLKPDGRQLCTTGDANEP